MAHVGEKRRLQTCHLLGTIAGGDQFNLIRLSGRDVRDHEEPCIPLAISDRGSPDVHPSRPPAGIDNRMFTPSRVPIDDAVRKRGVLTQIMQEFTALTVAIDELLILNDCYADRCGFGEGVIAALRLE